MRSRDGNRAFLYRLLFIISTFSFALNANEYLISYRYMVKNASIYNEELDVSRAMKKCKGELQEPLLLEIKKERQFKKIIFNNFDKFITYIQKLGIEVKHNDSTTNFEQTSTTIITLKTTCFKVDINDNLAKIVPLK